MRELNARTDIGGSRWTIPGLCDLVTVKTAQMLHHPTYEHIRKEILLPQHHRVRSARENQRLTTLPNPHGVCGRD